VGKTAFARRLALHRILDALLLWIDVQEFELLRIASHVWSFYRTSLCVSGKLDVEHLFGARSLILTDSVLMHDDFLVDFTSCMKRLRLDCMA